MMHSKYTISKESYMYIYSYIVIKHTDCSLRLSTWAYVFFKEFRTFILLSGRGTRGGSAGRKEVEALMMQRGKPSSKLATVRKENFNH